jgi:hypothetical protein
LLLFHLQGHAGTLEVSDKELHGLTLTVTLNREFSPAKGGKRWASNMENGWSF